MCTSSKYRATLALILSRVSGQLVNANPILNLLLAFSFDPLASVFTS